MNCRLNSTTQGGCIGQCRCLLYITVHTIALHILWSRLWYSQLRKWTFDIYGGCERFFLNNVCFWYFAKDKYCYWPIICQMTYNTNAFEKKFASPECQKQTFALMVIFCPTLMSSGYSKTANYCDMTHAPAVGHH